MSPLETRRPRVLGPMKAAALSPRSSTPTPTACRWRTCGTYSGGVVAKPIALVLPLGLDTRVWSAPTGFCNTELRERLADWGVDRRGARAPAPFPP